MAHPSWRGRDPDCRCLDGSWRGPTSPTRHLRLHCEEGAELWGRSSRESHGARRVLSSAPRGPRSASRCARRARRRLHLHRFPVKMATFTCRTLQFPSRELVSPQPNCMNVRQQIWGVDPAVAASRRPRRSRPRAGPRRVRMPLPKKGEQLSFADQRTHGGPRPDAGRKAQSLRPKLPHRKRPAHAYDNPVHVTMRRAKGLPSLAPRRRLVDRRPRLHQCRRGPPRALALSQRGLHVHCALPRGAHPTPRLSRTSPASSPSPARSSTTRTPTPGPR